MDMLPVEVASGLNIGLPGTAVGFGTADNSSEGWKGSEREDRMVVHLAGTEDAGDLVGAPAVAVGENTS